MQQTHESYRLAFCSLCWAIHERKLSGDWIAHASKPRCRPCDFDRLPIIFNRAAWTKSFSNPVYSISCVVLPIRVALCSRPVAN